MLANTTETLRFAATCREIAKTLRFADSALGKALKARGSFA
jgi:hypothetical protein